MSLISSICFPKAADIEKYIHLLFIICAYVYKSFHFLQKNVCNALRKSEVYSEPSQTSKIVLFAKFTCSSLYIWEINLFSQDLIARRFRKLDHLFQANTYSFSQEQKQKKVGSMFKCNDKGTRTTCHRRYSGVFIYILRISASLY